jgi:hypothetical protein
MWKEIIESSVNSVEMKLVKTFEMIGNELCWRRSCNSDEWILDEWCYDEAIDIDMLEYDVPKYLYKIMPKTCELVSRLKDDNYMNKQICKKGELDECVKEIVDVLHNEVVCQF